MANNIGSRGLYDEHPDFPNPLLAIPRLRELALVIIQLPDLLYSNSIQEIDFLYSISIQEFDLLLHFDCIVARTTMAERI